MRPKKLKTKIFLDSGDPAETTEIKELLGFLDGQTTNPSLVAKHPEAQERFQRGDKFTKDELLGFYQDVIQEVASAVPDGSVSIEVYADQATTSEEMFLQGKKMFSWIPNAHIKYPTTAAGLKAAEQSIQNGMRVNMTLCFTQEQAAAVYAATKGAPPGAVFVSPFVGRLDDRGKNGMNLIENILRMYGDGDGHVKVLAASVRNLAHHFHALYLASNIITAPASILREWKTHDLTVPDEMTYDTKNLKQIAYQEIDLQKHWEAFDIRHDLTEKGINRFAADWNALIKE